MPTPFRYVAVQKLREAERDAKQRELAREVAHETRLIEKQVSLRAEQLSAFNELNGIQAPKSDAPAVAWRVDQILAHHQLVSDLSDQLTQIESTLEDTRSRIQRCRQELLEANSAVKGLEKLAQRHHIEQLDASRSREDRERDDWQLPKRAI